MTPTSRREELAEVEPPGLLGFRTWQGVYVFVFGWFVLVVLLLTVLSVIFA